MTIGDRIGVARAAPVGYIIGEREKKMITGSLVRMRGGRKERGILIATLRDRKLCCVRWDKPFGYRRPLEVCWLAASNLEIVSEVEE